MVVLDRAQPEPAVTRADRVAIVGGGASGVLTALQLLSSSDDSALCVTVHEATRRPRPGHRLRHLGPAAPAQRPGPAHERVRRRPLRPPRLGAPRRPRPRPARLPAADGVLGLPPGHARRCRRPPPDDQRRPGRRHRAGRATASSCAPATGSPPADTVVLAHGNQAPQALAVGGVDLAELPGYLPNPWDLAAIRALPDDAVVVIVGTGLTAIDTAITLLEDSPAPPRRHGQPARPAPARPHRAAVHGLGQRRADRSADRRRHRRVRARPGRARPAPTASTGATSSTACARPTQSIWGRLDLDERRRFLSTYVRDWEVRRHRMAPEVADRIRGYRRDGRLTVLDGGLAAVETRGPRAPCASPTCRSRSSPTRSSTAPGPLTDLDRTTDPLLQALQLARPGGAGPAAARARLHARRRGRRRRRAGRPRPVRRRPAPQGHAVGVDRDPGDPHPGRGGRPPGAGSRRRR